MILLLVNILACCRQRIRRINIITIRVIKYYNYHQQHGSIKEDTKQQSRHRWFDEVNGDDDDSKEEVEDYIDEEACV